MAKRKSKLASFVKDYPIIVVLALVFFVGAWLGFVLGRQSLVQAPRTIPSVRAPLPRKAIAHAPARPTKPEPKAPAVLPFYRGFLKPSVSHEVRVTPLAKKEKRPQIVFVIDDIGYGQKWADLLFSIGPNVTLAILPQLPYSRYFAVEGKRRGFETILHLPLEPESEAEDPGPGEIKTGMSSHEIRALLRQNLDSVPGVIGVNNHMGSRATQSETVMFEIARELKKRNFIFLDSLTHPDSIAYKTAHFNGLTAFHRNVFLDNEDDFDYIKEHIKEAAQMAKQNGFAIAIGHIRYNTILAIKEMIPSLQAEGLEIVTLKDLAKR